MSSAEITDPFLEQENEAVSKVGIGTPDSRLVVVGFLGTRRDNAEEERRTVDASLVADFIISTTYGTIQRGVTLEDPTSIENGRTAIDDYVDAQGRSCA